MSPTWGGKIEMTFAGQTNQNFGGKPRASHSKYAILELQELREDAAEPSRLDATTKLFGPVLQSPHHRQNGSQSPKCDRTVARITLDACTLENPERGKEGTHIGYTLFCKMFEPW